MLRVEEEEEDSEVVEEGGEEAGMGEVGDLLSSGTMVSSSLLANVIVCV